MVNPPLRALAAAEVAQLMAQLPALLWVVDRDDRFTATLGGALRELGSWPNRVVGMSLAEYYETDERSQPTIAAHDSALAGRPSTYVYEWRERIYQCHVEPFRDDAGAVVGSIGVAFDITERRRIDERFQALVEGLDAIVWEADPQTFRFLYVSPAAERILGYPIERWTADPDFWIEHLHPDDREAAVETCVRATAAGENHELEYRMVAADGSSVWLHDVVRVDRDDSGEPRALRGILVDTTELRRIGAALEESERHFRHLVESSADVISIVDHEGTVLYHSPAIRRVLGYEPLERVGSSVFDLIHEEDLPRARRAFDAAVRDKQEPRPIELRIRHKDGSWRALESSGRPVDGHLIATSRDLTEWREAERRLRATEAQLRHAQRLDAIGMLGAGVAHDLNNILMVVGACSDELQGSEAEAITKAVARGSRLTRRLMRLGRQETGERRAGDVGAVLTELAELLRPALGGMIDVEIAIQPNLPAVLIDPTQIEQVVLNLALNARDAMPNGGTLSIEAAATTVAAAEPEVPAGDYVVVRVDDTGEGMSDEVRRRLFEPFFTTKGDLRGSGLGLATVQAVVADHGGRIRVASSPQSGTRFEIFLPALGEREAA
jgi:PAS domain S-box-containing protein